MRKRITSPLKPRLTNILLALLATSLLSSACDDPPPPPQQEIWANWDEDSCMMIDDGSSNGLGDLEVNTVDLGTSTTVYYPVIITSSSCTFPVIGWGNGTSASGGYAYPETHEQWASYGFVVAVAHTNMALIGTPILDSVNAVFAAADDPSSILHNRLDIQIGIAGKSQGAIAATRDVDADSRAVVAVAMAGATSNVSKPAIFLTGTDDFLRNQTLTGYETASDAAVYAEASGVDHMGMNTYIGSRNLATSFLRCYLRNDVDSCSYSTCESCQVENWADFRSKNF
jgi:hypothetical protein